MKKFSASIRNGNKHPYLSDRKIGYIVSVDTDKKECQVKFFEVGHLGENDAIAIMTYDIVSHEALIQTLTLYFPVSDVNVDYTKSINDGIYNVLVTKVFSHINDYYNVNSLTNSNAVTIDSIFNGEINKRSVKDNDNDGMVLKRPKKATTMEVGYQFKRTIVDETPCVLISLVYKLSKAPLFGIRLIFDNHGNLYAYKKTSYCNCATLFDNEELTLATPELSAELTMGNSTVALHQNFLKEAEDQLSTKYNLDFGDPMEKINFYKEFDKMIKHRSSRNSANDEFEQIPAGDVEPIIYLHADYHPALFKVVFKLSDDGAFINDCTIYKKDVYWKDDEKFHVIYDNIIPADTENTVRILKKSMSIAFNKIIDYTADEVVYGKITINPFIYPFN